MLIKNQKVKNKWITKDRAHYEDRGYVYTKHLDGFIVNVNDLKDGSGIKVGVICDCCFEPFQQKYCKYVTNSKSVNNKDCCAKKTCIQKKVVETNIKKYGVSNSFQREDVKDKIKTVLLDEFGVTNVSQIKEVKDKVKSKNAFSVTDMKKYISDNSNCVLLTVNDFDAQEIINFKCLCGNDFATTFHKFKNQNKRQCNDCGYKDSRGENHHSWRGGITSSEKMLRKSKEYLDWRVSVFVRDDYTCQCCFKVGGTLNAHHIESFSDHLELRTEINNGITLCEECHAVQISGSFHSLYGTQDFTKFQLIDYITNKRMNLGLNCTIPNILILS